MHVETIIGQSQEGVKLDEIKETIHVIEEVIFYVYKFYFILLLLLLLLLLLQSVK